jgi:HD-GYP domain-containing protein (c-di-GMP phosphodiesterase class II)
MEPAAGDRRFDPGRALRAALCSGGRRIHVEQSGEGVRLRCRVGTKLREVARIPPEAGSSMVALLEDTARDGMGALTLDGGKVTIHYRLASCEGSSGKTLVLTLLPGADRGAVESLQSLTASEDVRGELARDLSTRRGLILVAGSPGSGRGRTLRALVGEGDLQSESLLGLAFDRGAPSLEAPYPTLELDLRDELWSLLERVESLDADRIVMPELRTPLQATLALALSGGHRVGLAPIRAQDTAGALVKMRELAADRYRAARDLMAVLAQHRLPRPCPHCSALRSLDERNVSFAGWEPASLEQLRTRRLQVRSRGKGCERCVGSGYTGWTYLYEYLSVTDDIAEHLRATVDPGKLREELKAVTAGRGLLDAGWREALRGHIEFEDLERIPRPEVVPFRLDASTLDEHPDAAEIERPVLEVSPGEFADEVALERRLACGAGVDHPLYPRAYESLRQVVAAIDEGRVLDDASIVGLADRIVVATGEDPELVHLALTAGRGDNLVVHQLNVAILAVRIGLGLRWDRERLACLSFAALVHDVGLIRIPITVLEKERPLTEAEERTRRGHVELTEQLLRGAFPDHEWLHAVVRQVHERESGHGFPDGLPGPRIDPLAKAIGLADVLESLTHPRRGRPAMSAFDAIQYLLTSHADDFDRRIFRAMVRQISPFPVGSRVRLNNGSTARVTSANPDNFYRPKVEILADPDGKRLAGRRVMDLDDSPYLYITGPSVDGDPAGATS